MAEYIESTKMADVIHRYFVGYKVEDMIRDIREEAAADVAPVVHGHYVTDEWGDSSCSVCGENYLNATQNYCPNCGARMDGE